MEKITAYKKLGAPSDTQTNNVADMTAPTGNLYETAMIIAKRADQISMDLKSELAEKLEDFAYTQDNLEEVFEDKEQIELSKSYERMPKPTLLALKEFADNRILFHEPKASHDSPTSSPFPEK